MKFFIICVTLCVFSILKVEGNVNQCYFCDGTCNDPLDIEDCPTYLGLNFRCVSSAAEDGDVSLEVKGCVQDTAKIISDCKTLDDADGGRCRLCDTDLCNSAEMVSVTAVALTATFTLFARLL